MRKVLSWVLVAILLASCSKDDEVPRTVMAINLDKTVVDLLVEETVQLTASYEPDNVSTPTYVWATLNQDIATVSQQGKVTGLKKGTVVITVTTKEYPSLIARCTVNVAGEGSGAGITSIALSKESIGLTLGDTVHLQVQHVPSSIAAPLYVWSSSNSDIVSVSSEGVVKALAKGTAVVTVRVRGNDNVSATCTVTVTELAVTKIVLNKTSIEMALGAKEGLTYTFEPVGASSDVEWSTSDGTVATVLNGTVTALKEGQALITVKQKNGSVSATCTVTVLNVSSIPVTGISFDKKQQSIQLGDTQVLTYAILPANATNKAVTWFSNNVGVATVDKDGKVTALALGTATIEVQTEDGNMVARCTVTVLNTVDYLITATTTNKTTVEDEQLYRYLTYSLNSAEEITITKLVFYNNENTAMRSLENLGNRTVYSYSYSDTLQDIKFTGWTVYLEFTYRGKQYTHTHAVAL